MRQVGVTRKALAPVMRRPRAEIARQQAAYGGTMRAAPWAVRHDGAGRTATILCLVEPPGLRTVGARYADFRQVEDAEVRRLLTEVRAAT